MAKRRAASGRGVRRASPIVRGRASGHESRMRLSAATGGMGEFSRGFKSKAQWRKFWADPRLRRYARKKARATKGGKVVRYRRLPERKTARG